MTSYIDRCIFNPVSGSTADFVVAKAVQGYQTPAQASATDQSTFTYAAEVKNGLGQITQWEEGRGVYTAASATLSRATVLWSSNNNSPVAFSTPPNVMITIVSTDVPTVISAANPTGTGGSTVATNGVATTFLRSDAAFPMQNATNAQKGVVQVDGTTITAATGTITAATATTAALGIVKPDNTTIAVAAGVLNATTATTAALGIVKPDNTTVTIAAGVLSASASVSGANPTATGGSTSATNGVAGTYLRSDGAFPMQNATSGQKGVVQVDGTTITASTGVISAVTASTSQKGIVQLGTFLSTHPADVTSTSTNTGTFTMMGLGGTLAVTPQFSGRVLFSLHGAINDLSGNAVSVSAKLRYGTGAAPSNGAAETGTQISGTTFFSDTFAGSSTFVSFPMTGFVTGLTTGTAYWFDASITNGSNGDTLRYTNINGTLIEL